MQAPHRVPRRDGGFTINELLVVIGIVAVVSAISVPVTMSMVKRAKADSATVVTQTFLDTVRDRAVAERRNIELTFIAPNRLRAQRIEVPSGVRTTVGEMTLDSGQQFLRFAGQPDTPDGFGASAAINFTGTLPVMFTSDGSLIDSAGDVTNGSLFFGVPQEPLSARAVTIFGVTGLLRTWKWGGAQWLQ